MTDKVKLVTTEMIEEIIKSNTGPNMLFMPLSVAQDIADSMGITIEELGAQIVKGKLEDQNVFEDDESDENT